MAYKWKPSASQKREFAMNMQNEEFKSDYLKRKEDKADKRRSTSKFNYNNAGGRYIPTRTQYVFCSENMHEFNTFEEKDAMNIVMSGYACNDKVHHDYIHIINEKIRNKSTNY